MTKISSGASMGESLMGHKKGKRKREREFAEWLEQFPKCPFDFEPCSDAVKGIGVGVWSDRSLMCPRDEGVVEG